MGEGTGPVVGKDGHGTPPPISSPTPPVAPVDGSMTSQEQSNEKKEPGAEQQATPTTEGNGNMDSKVAEETEAQAIAEEKKEIEEIEGAVGEGDVPSDPDASKSTTDKKTDEAPEVKTE